MRDASMTGGRSPIKANVFHRYTGNRKKKWCPNDGRGLVYFKDADGCFSCTECGYTIYTEQSKQQQQPEQQIGGINSVDGLSDTITKPNRGASKFRSIKDPRSRFLKPKSQLDPELQKLVDEQGVTIIRYEERVVEDNQTLSSEELRQNK